MIPRPFGGISTNGGASVGDEGTFALVIFGIVAFWALAMAACEIYDLLHPSMPRVPDPNDGSKHVLKSRIEPDGNRWSWEVWFEIDDVRRAYCVKGSCRDQAKAEERCSEATANARERFTALMSEKMRKESLGKTTVIPL